MEYTGCLGGSLVLDTQGNRGEVLAFDTQGEEVLVLDTRGWLTVWTMCYITSSLLIPPLDLLFSQYLVNLFV